MASKQSVWRHLELTLLLTYAALFYIVVTYHSLRLSNEYGAGGAKSGTLKGLRQGWIGHRFNDISDSQWRNFRGNLPILTLVLGIFILFANAIRSTFHLQGKGLSVLWILLSLTYIIYLHGVCTIFILAIAVGNFFITKIFNNVQIFPAILWIFNILVLVCNRLFGGYSFSLFGQSLAFLDNYRGTFRWHICFNFVMLRMLSFGLDYHWACRAPKMDWKRHMQNCELCQSGKSCYHARQALNFMWLKFLLIWRYFRFWALIGGIETPENMPHCINNCYDLEGFWKSWHASYNRWLVRYLYIPLGGSQKKLFNVWPIFTFVAIWHDLEWKLLSWAWVTCLFWMPEVLFKSILHTSQVQNMLNKFLVRELSAIGGAITISCLMMANLIGFVVGPSGMQWLISRMLLRESKFVLIGIFTSFYIGTKLMFHVRESETFKNAKQ